MVYIYVGSFFVSDKIEWLLGFVVDGISGILLFTESAG